MVIFDNIYTLLNKYGSLKSSLVFGVAKILVDEGGLFAHGFVGRLEYVSVNRVEIMKWINDFWKPILGMDRRSVF